MVDKKSMDALKSGILALMFFRVVLAVLFLGSVSWIQLGRTVAEKTDYYLIYTIIALVGFLTIIYSVLLKRVEKVRLFAFLQISIDILLVTVVVYITGGIASYLSILYFLTVIGGAILLGQPGGFFCASLSSVFYGILILLDYYLLLPIAIKTFHPMVPTLWEDVITSIFTHTLSFFTVAFLTGYLAERTEKVERRLEEKEIDLERIDSLNRVILQNVNVGIMTLDEGYKVTTFNKAAEKIMDIRLSDCYGRGVGRLFPGIFNISPDSLDNMKTRREAIFKHQDDKDCFIGYSVSRGKGRDTAYIVIFQDLTDVKVMEERIRRDEKLRALGELSAGMAHEVRNPLASISGSIQVLKDELDLEEDNLRLMNIVLRESTRLNSLITDFLLFAKPGQKRRGLVDLSGLITETVSVFKNSPEAKGLEVEEDVEGGITTAGDQRQLTQVLWNLFVNASQAMDGKGTLSVSLKMDGGDGGGGEDGSKVCHITVSDTGGGIDEEDMKSIFDPFYSTRDGGTGLGLALTHRIVRSHGGNIEVGNEDGSGAVFTITLPFNEPEADREVSQLKEAGY